MNNILKKTLFLTLIITISGILWAQNNKIISLAPGYTRQIYNLKADSNLIAHTKYSKNIRNSSQKAIIGTVVNINVEKIHSLQPDLIISSTLTRKKQIQQLKKLGLNVQIFHQPQNKQDIFNQYRKIADFVGKERLAKKQLQTYKNKIDSLTKIIATTGTKEKKPEIFIQIGRKPLYAVHKKNYLNKMIELLNCKNSVQAQNSGIYDREKVLANNPEFIIIALEKSSAREAKQEWKKYNSLHAVKNNQIFIVDPNIFNTPTPKNFFLAYEKAANIIYSIDGTG